MCRICMVQTQRRKYVLDHADDTVLTRRQELDHTSTGEESIFPKVLRHEVGIYYLSDV